MHQKNYLELNWQHSPKLNELPEKLGEWILHPGSFMDRLRSFDAKTPEVQVLRQSWQFLAQNEETILEITGNEQALIREVLILSPGKKWMYARTVFPRKTLTGEDQALSQLENRSLGSVLFNDPSVQRSPFDVICLTEEMPFQQYVLTEAGIVAKHLWARRSKFLLHNKPLLLTEVFLPDIATL